MKLSVEQYIKLSFVLRKNKSTDIIKTDENELRRHLEIIHNEVADRMKFNMPTHYINAYDVDSYIAPLNEKDDYHHYIDISMFSYFYHFFSAMELDVPNYGHGAK